MADEFHGDSVIYLISLMSAIGFCALSMAAASGEKTAFSKDYIVIMVSSLYESESVEEASQDYKIANPIKDTIASHTKHLASEFTINDVVLY